MAQDNVIKFTKLSEELNTVISKQITVLGEAATNLDKLNTSYGKLPSEYVKSMKDALDIEKKQVQIRQALITEEQKKADLLAKTSRKEAAALRTKQVALRLSEQQARASKKETQAITSKIPTLRQLNSFNKELNNEYSKQSKILNDLRLKYKSLALSEGESSKEAKKLLNQIKELDARLKRVDASVGQFNRNVGNYSSAMRGAVGAARSLASAMGLLGGAFLVVNVFRDAFKRVRDFDNEMQNMAGILRTTRPELKEIENRIIAVSAASTKTSNEVAQLATSLFVLGKTKKEVLDLLEPVNNLSIALGATSGDTGEFLVQTLNAFGKGSESANEFADTIAAIRTSTSLDFEKMRDSFQYITPISRILGRDLAYTGSVVGVLADNGIKAESAGRLLATAQIKLATSGRTLQEALDELNNAYIQGKDGTELLTIANESFGKQAAKIGVILATQQDRIQQYDEKIRQAAGSLDDLVEEQLKSLGSQLKITTSVWEEFVLSIENGEGPISKALSSTLSVINDIIKGFTLLNKTTEEYNEYLKEDVANKTLKDLTKAYREMGDNAEEIAIEDADRARDKIDDINKEIKALKEKNKALKDENNFGTGFRKSASLILPGIVSSVNPEITKTDKKIRDLSASLGFYTGMLNAAEKVIVQTDESQKELNNTLDETNNALDEANKKLDEANKKLSTGLGGDTNTIRNKNLKAVSDLKEANTSYRLEIEKVIKELTLLQSVERKGTKAYNELETSIKALKQTFEPLEISVKRANDEIQRGIDIDKQRARELAALQQATQQYMKSFQTDFFQGAGLGSLEQFFDGSFDELLKGSSDKWSVYFNAIAEVAQEAFNYISQVTQANFQNELNMLEKRKQAQLLFAGEGTAARERIEEQYEKRRAAIQKKQAEAQKKQAIFNALINTGQAVVSVLAQERGGVAKKAIAAAIVGGLGLAQVAFIASQKIPEFKDGVRNFEGGNAIVGDGGVSEIIRTNKGVYATPSTDTLVNLPAGADVFKNHDEYFNNVMGEMGVLPSIPKINVVNNGLTKIDLDRVMAKHFSNIQVNQTTMDINGYNTYLSKKNSKTVIKNNRRTFKGFSV